MMRLSTRSASAMGAVTAAAAAALPRTLQLPLLPLAAASAAASCPPPAAAHHPHRPAHSHRAFSTFVPPPRPGSTPSAAAAADESAPTPAAAAAVPPPPPRDPNAYSNPNAPSWKRISWKDEERRAKKEERRDSLREEVKQLTGRGMVELYKSGGKPHTTPPALANAYTARPIPPAAIDALTLDEQAVRLPEDCEKYAATFLAVGFNQQTMDFGDRWLDEIVKTYPQDAAQKDVRCLQLSIISNSLIGALFGSYLTRRLRSSSTPERQARVVLLKNNVFDAAKIKSTFVPPPPPPKIVGGAKNAPAAAAATPPPARSAMEVEPGWSIQNPLLLHLFVVDRAGRIRWRAVGPPQDGDLDVARRVLAQLVDEQRNEAGRSSRRGSAPPPPRAAGGRQR